MIAENFAEKGRQRSYAEFSATDVKGFYLIIVLAPLANTVWGIFLFYRIQHIWHLIEHAPIFLNFSPWVFQVLDYYLISDDVMIGGWLLITYILQAVEEGLMLIGGAELTTEVPYSVIIIQG